MLKTPGQIVEKVMKRINRACKSGKLENSSEDGLPDATFTRVFSNTLVKDTIIIHKFNGGSFHLDWADIRSCHYRIKLYTR